MTKQLSLHLHIGVCPGCHRRIRYYETVFQSAGQVWHPTCLKRDVLAAEPYIWPDVVTDAEKDAQRQNYPH